MGELSDGQILLGSLLRGNLVSFFFEGERGRV